MTEPRTVTLFLGPYRNLTTLTASILALHPNVQVLNHGKGEVFDGPRNFIRNKDPAAFTRFIDAAIALSEAGQRGDKGGSIVFSHAFDHDPVREAYAARFGDALRKPDIQALVWKESLRVSNVLRRHRIDVGALLERLPTLRFLMPVRHPLDVAASNMETGHWEVFRDLPERTLPAVLDAVLDEIAWFFDLAERHPDRFFSYFQDGFDQDTLLALARFLDIPHDTGWAADANRCFVLRSRRRHDPQVEAQFKSAVAARLQRHPTVRDRVLGFLLRDDQSGV